MPDREKLLERARSGVRENRTLEFKSAFDITARGSWCELIKDVAAFANSGGGVIVFGMNDNCTPSGFDVAPLLALDPAEMTNYLARYTNYQFSDFEIVPLDRGGSAVAAMLIEAVAIPLVFERPGTYEDQPGRQKTAFSKGTVYFRHGAKSEPATMADLRDWLDRELEKTREEWKKGIREVVETSPGETVRVLRVGGRNDGAIDARIVADPNAALFRPDNAQAHWPHRQADLIRSVRRQLGPIPFNGHDVQCVRRQYDIHPATRPDWVFKPHAKASPQYSETFAIWIADQLRANPAFLAEARRFFRENR